MFFLNIFAKSSNLYSPLVNLSSLVQPWILIFNLKHPMPTTCLMVIAQTSPQTLWSSYQGWVSQHQQQVIMCHRLYLLQPKVIVSQHSFQPPTVRVHQFPHILQYPQWNHPITIILFLLEKKLVYSGMSGNYSFFYGISCMLVNWTSYRANVELLIKNASGTRYKGFLTHQDALVFYLDAKMMRRVHVIRDPGDDQIYGPEFKASQ